MGSGENAPRVLRQWQFCAMETSKKGYDSPPWHFKGKALYQISLVRIDEAKKYIPHELALVNFFGWTLGGFYLARYSDSPVGPFDEMVAMAGLAWNFPSSCAWAARVYVNNREARDHGIREVGLPSRLAAFKALPLPSLSTRTTTPSSSSSSSSSSPAANGANRCGGGPARSTTSITSSSSSRGSAAGAGSGSLGDGEEDGSLLDRAVSRLQSTGASWWDNHPLPLGGGPSRRGGGGSSGVGGPPGTWAVELSNEEPHRPGWLPSLPGSWAKRRRGSPRGLAGGQVCRIELPLQRQGRGPRIQMCLPSFSGATPDHPGFLQYDLQLRANIRPVPAARLAFPPSRPAEDRENSEVLDLVLGGWPIICLEFGDMDMKVQAPVPWHPRVL